MSPLRVLVVMTAIVQPARAQLVQSALGELSARDRVRLRLADETVLEGRIARIDTVQLALRSVVRRSVHEASLVDSTVRWDSIIGISVQRGTKWRTGAYVGGAAGLVFGFVGSILAAPGGLEATSDCGQSCQAAYIVGGTVGGILVGSAVGALFPNWRNVGSK